MSEEKESKPLTHAEAHALVAFAIQNSEGSPDWLVGMLTAIGPIVVAVSGEKPEGDFVTDHVIDAVNWLVESDRILPDKASTTALAERLAELALSSQRWDAVVGRGFNVDSAREAGDEMSALIKTIVSSFNLEFSFEENEPVGQLGLFNDGRE